MKRAGIVLTVLFALLAFVCGFGGVGAALLITRPATDVHEEVRFVVNKGDTTTDVAENLAKAGLIRNADIFRLYARFKKLDTGIQQGVYTLNTDMTMDQIIAKLQKAIPDEIVVTIPPGLRVEQYMSYLSDLPNVDENDFAKIVKTGQLPDGTNLSDDYWFIPKKAHAHIVNALEGYLYPDTYYFDASADAADVVTRLLDTLGSHLCPGPDDNPYAYVSDLTQCKAHAVTVDKDGKVTIFAAMEKAYNTKDDTEAFYKTLTFASIVMREQKISTSDDDAYNASLADVQGITNVYYTRYQAINAKIPNTGDTYNLGADPTTQYALDTDKPPSDGKYWQPLPDAASKIELKNPYNTNAPDNANDTDGLPPGPISAPFKEYILAAANPSTGQYFFFLHDACGKALYAKTSDEQASNKAKYIDSNGGKGACAQ